MTKNLSTPALASIWFFYVPHRLSWSDWPAFLSKEDGAPAFPSTTADSSNFFDRISSTHNMSPLYRRAFKIAYNEYFGSEAVGSSGNAWYDDTTADTDVSLRRTRTPEQFASKMQLDGAVVDPEFTVTASTIPLNEFYRSMMNARSTQRSQMTGNKYVDTLARMGVDASWMIAERPEFLGTKSLLVAPQLTAGTGSTDLGQEVARFNAKLSCEVKGKHFAEHGYVVGIGSMRPIIFGNSRGAPDATMIDIDDFYSADNLDTKDRVDDSINGFDDPSNPNAWTSRFAYLKNGAWLNGAGSSWVVSNTYTDFKGIIYPSPSDVPTGDELGTKQVAFTTTAVMTGKTPVPNRVA